MLLQLSRQKRAQVFFLNVHAYLAFPIKRTPLFKTTVESLLAFDFGRYGYHSALSKADILVTPPVPALAIAFLMQPGSAVLHLLSNGNLGEDQRLIKSLVRSSGLYYLCWQNKHSGRNNHVTKTLVVPSYVIIRELGRVFTEICSLMQMKRPVA